MNTTAHAWAEMALNRVHEYYRCKKVTAEFMENARIARALVGPVAAKGWIAAARNHNHYAIEAKRDSRKYLSKVKVS
jgi:hypothetical protein